MPNAVLNPGIVAQGKQLFVWAMAAVKQLAARGVNVSVVRLPQVHDTRKQGLIPYVHAVAREKRVSAYIGDGGNRRPAAHVSDVARH